MNLPISIVEEYENGMSTIKLAKKYNCSVSTIQTRLVKYGAKMRSPFVYTEEMYQFIRDNIKGTSYKKMTDLFNKRFGTDLKYSTIKSTIKRIGCVNGIDGSFQKGNEPFNKGLKWDDFISEEGQENSRKTCFQKDKNINNQRHKWCEAGTEYIDKNGYILVRLSEKDGRRKGHKYWKAKHYIVWEEHNGEVPKGYNVIFADGNKRNFDIDNLVLVSNAELLIMNSNGLYYKGYAELTKEGSLISKVIAKGIERKSK